MLFKKIASPLLVLVIAGFGSSAIAAPRTFKIDDEKKRDVVSFTSDAPLELINGTTHGIKGSITIDDSLNLTKPVQCSFNVDLASIDTGIELRNEHMRDNFLETKKYPQATFEVTKLSNPPASLKPGTKVKFDATGKFSCHGKTVEKKIPIEVTYFTKCAATESKQPDCDLLQLKATFPVVFKDHDIKRPEAVFQKLADSVLVTVSATAYNQVSGSGSKAKDSAVQKKAK